MFGQQDAAKPRAATNETCTGPQTSASSRAPNMYPIWGYGERRIAAIIAPNAPRHAREELQVFAIDADHKVTPDGADENKLNERSCGGELPFRLKQTVGKRT